MPSNLHTPRENLLLAALPPADYERLLPHLEVLTLPLGWAIYETGSKQSSVYFPTDSIISHVHITASGNSTDVAITGNDGLVGIPSVMGGETSLYRAIVRSAGSAYRLQYAEVKKAFENGGGVQDLLLRHTQALMTQTAQTVVCNRHHSVEQRLCRWLLMSIDRLPGEQLNATQELIANMLGVRREGVTEAASQLQSAGLIRYSPGHITILDRPKMEAWVCECYAVVKRETNRLLPQKQTGSNRARKPPLPSRTTINPIYVNEQTGARQHAMNAKA